MNNNPHLDQVLKGAVPVTEMPPALHGSIMRAVRTAGPPVPSVRKFSLPRCLAVPALAAVVLAAWAWQSASRPAPAQSAISSATVALAKSEAVVRAVSDSALAPLNDEWRRVNQDLQNTAAFVMASLP